MAAFALASAVIRLRTGEAVRLHRASVAAQGIGPGCVWRGSVFGASAGVDMKQGANKSRGDHPNQKWGLLLEMLLARERTHIGILGFWAQYRDAFA